jgi:dUTP pyrophosphatase
MTTPFRIKLLTSTAKPPHRNSESDLWDLYADGFCVSLIKEEQFIVGTEYDELAKIPSQGRILVKTGISLELPKAVKYDDEKIEYYYGDMPELKRKGVYYEFYSYAVADIRPRSGLALKHGITVLNSPGTIDNSYRKEIGVILYNAGHEPYTITKGDKIAQMLIRPLYPSKMEIVKDIEDTDRGGYGSTGK